MVSEVTSSAGGSYWGHEDDRAQFIREKMRKKHLTPVEARKQFEEARQRQYGQ